jgi:hypothetical protein
MSVAYEEKTPYLPPMIYPLLLYPLVKHPMPRLRASQRSLLKCIQHARSHRTNRRTPSRSDTEEPAGRRRGPESGRRNYKGVERTARTKPGTRSKCCWLRVIRVPPRARTMPAIKLSAMPIPDPVRSSCRLTPAARCAASRSRGRISSASSRVRIFSRLLRSRAPDISSKVIIYLTYRTDFAILETWKT